MISFFALIIGMLILSLCKGYAYFDWIVCVVIVLFSAGYIFDLVKGKRNTVYGIPLLLAYLIRIVFLFYDVYSDDPFNLPLIGGELSSDPLGFFNSAVKYSMGQQINYGGYFSKLFGVIFYLTDSSRLWAEFVVLLFSIATLHVTTSILNEIDVTQRVRRNSMYLIGLMPNYILLSVVFRRETIITFFVSLSLLYLLRWIHNRGGNTCFVLAIVFALIASMFHGGTALIVVGYIFAYLIFDPRSGKFVLKQSRIIGTVIFSLAFIVIFLEFGSIFFEKLERLSGAETIGSVRDVGGSSYAKYVGDSRTPIRALIYALPRYLYFMFSPFPWQWRGITDIITFIMSSFFYMYIILSAIKYIMKTDRTNRKRNTVIVLLIAAILIAFVFSWGVTNTGTATRHRDKFIVLYIVIYALTRKTTPEIGNNPVQRSKHEQ